jgi:hypothetical protein
MICIFGRKRVRVWCTDKSVPPHIGMTLGVREWRHIFVGLDRICAPPRPIKAKKGARPGSLNLVSKTKLIAVKGDGLIDVAEDENGESPAGPVVS